MHTEIDNDNVRQQFTLQTQFGKIAWNGDAQSIIIIISVYKESEYHIARYTYFHTVDKPFCFCLR